MPIRIRFDNCTSTIEDLPQSCALLASAPKGGYDVISDGFAESAPAHVTVEPALECLAVCVRQAAGVCGCGAVRVLGVVALIECVVGEVAGYSFADQFALKEPSAAGVGAQTTFCP